MDFIGPAPLFDNGTSIFNCDEQIPEESTEYLRESFKNRNDYIKHPSRLDLSGLKNIKDMIKEVYSHSNIKQDRINAMATAIDLRANIATQEIKKYVHKEKMRQKQKEAERELK